ncbi:MAG TPA: hypothetical protein VF650_13300 [Allosphingosinicella sp.]|jgi:hypothetical protein
MNTPPKKRRHDKDKALETLERAKPRGAWAHSLDNPEYAISLAGIVAGFVHLESNMVKVLAVLLGMKDTHTARYVWRSVKSPRGRIEMLRVLLQEAPENIDAEDHYDFILSEFSRINSRRNDFVHGQWYTDILGSGAVMLAKLNTDPHGFGFHAAEPVELKELQTLQADIGELHRFINMWVIPAFGPRQLSEHPPPPSEPDPD